MGAQNSVWRDQFEEVQQSLLGLSPQQVTSSCRFLSSFWLQIINANLLRPFFGDNSMLLSSSVASKLRRLAQSASPCPAFKSQLNRNKRASACVRHSIRPTSHAHLTGHRRVQDFRISLRPCFSLLTSFSFLCCFLGSSEIFQCIKNAKIRKRRAHP